MSQQLSRNRTYFVDSGAWKALLDRKDQWHAVTERIFRELTELRVNLLTTDVVILEFITLARKSVSLDRVLNYVDSIFRTAEIVYTLAEDIESARRTLLRYTAITFSGFDASSIAVMERLNISRVLTTDDEFIKYSRFVDVRPNFHERKTVLGE